MFYAYLQVWKPGSVIIVISFLLREKVSKGNYLLIKSVPDCDNHRNIYASRKRNEKVKLIKTKEDMFLLVKLKKEIIQ